jgi:hypothetical protein
MNKRTILFLLSALLLSAYILAPIPPNKGWGAYNTISRTIYCPTDTLCLHEIAHKLDHEGGWVSRQHEFSVAVRVYMLLEMREDEPSQLVWDIMYTPGLFMYESPFYNHLSEVYATIFIYSRGDSEAMPERLREFYDWERAAELIEKYARTP